MLEWLTVIVGVIGLAIVLAMPALMWYMVIYGLVQIVREEKGMGDLLSQGSSGGK